MFHHQWVVFVVFELFKTYLHLNIHVICYHLCKFYIYTCDVWCYVWYVVSCKIGVDLFLLFAVVYNMLMKMNKKVNKILCFFFITFKLIKLKWSQGLSNNLFERRWWSGDRKYAETRDNLERYPKEVALQRSVCADHWSPFKSRLSRILSAHSRRLRLQLSNVSANPLVMVGLCWTGDRSSSFCSLEIPCRCLVLSEKRVYLYKYTIYTCISFYYKITSYVCHEWKQMKHLTDDNVMRFRKRHM